MFRGQRNPGLGNCQNWQTPPSRTVPGSCLRPRGFSLVAVLESKNHKAWQLKRLELYLFRVRIAEQRPVTFLVVNQVSLVLFSYAHPFFGPKPLEFHPVSLVTALGLVSQPRHRQRMRSVLPLLPLEVCRKWKLTFIPLVPENSFVGPLWRDR